jgi:hypothetical protein
MKSVLFWAVIHSALRVFTGEADVITALLIAVFAVKLSSHIFFVPLPFFQIDRDACNTLKYAHFSPIHRGVAQPGSAFAWGAKGREFKSLRPDHF